MSLSKTVPPPSSVLHSTIFGVFRFHGEKPAVENYGTFEATKTGGNPKKNGSLQIKT
jgi:hypothetical protein